MTETLADEARPIFRLRAGEIVMTSKGPALRIDRPLLVVRLTRDAAAVLEALPRSAEDLAMRTGQTVRRVVATLRAFEARGLVTRDARANPSRFPTVSVVVPSYSRPDGTRATVLSVLALDYPQKQLEILVIDDASPAPLDLADLAHEGVRVLRLAENGGPAAARNVGLGAATGELVAFLDNDCTAARDWLRILVAELEDEGVDVAGGRAIAPPPAGKRDVVAAYEAVRSPLDMGAARSNVGLGEAVPYLPSCNLVVRRGAAAALGGFRKGMHLGEDVDFIWRARAATSRVVYEPSAKIVHHHRTKLFELLKRRAQYASSEAVLARLHPASRRVIVIPVTACLALTALLCTPASTVPLAIALVVTAAQINGKKRQMGALGLSSGQVGRAVLRAHGASLYHLSAMVARYQSVVVVAIAIAFPRVRLVAAALLLTAPIVDARVRGAKIPLPVYVALSTLEMAAYQLGILWGRIAHRTLLVPRVRLRR